MHHFDNQISQSAIEFLNTSYFSRGDFALSFEESFLKRSIEFLSGGLQTLDLSKETEIPCEFDLAQKRECDVTAAYTLVRRALDLLLSHLILFQERYSFHLRIWRLQGKPLERHCEERFPGLSERLALNPPTYPLSKGDSLKLRIKFIGYTDNYSTTLKLCSHTLLAELRAEIVYCLFKAGMYYGFSSNVYSV